MNQVNTCLKRIFTVFNIFFAIVGGIIIGLALLSQVYTNINGNVEGRTTSLLLLYVVGATTMVIAILGAYGAHKENRGCMIAFLVCMVIGSLMLLRAGIVLASNRSQVEPTLEEKLKLLVPLNQAPQEAQDMANNLQTLAQCCGLFSYEDWRSDIPDSCVCNDEEVMEDLCQTVSYTSIMLTQKNIYTKPCFPVIIHYLLLIIDIMVGIIFSLATLALLGLALSSLIIHQMRHPNRATVVLSVPAIFAPSMPKYQELQNPPPKYQESPPHY
ncbi:tetraspanin-8 [Labrus bergylta]|uniref:Tetraspanin n=1 Tax=Labrus bergylta TaxID=56723 RepID=A0A3Q3GMZ3_9LABR|nr:tetraspanin-8-like [Labrus bergylta]